MAQTRYYYVLFNKETGNIFVSYAKTPNSNPVCHPDAPAEKNALLKAGCKPIWINSIDFDDDEGIEELRHIWAFDIMYHYVQNGYTLTDEEVKAICDGWYHKLQQIRGLE